MESSADRAYRHYSPAPIHPPPSTSASASRGQPSATGNSSSSSSSSISSSRRGSKSDSVRHLADGGGGGSSSSLSPAAGFPGEEYDDVGTFSAGISVDRALSSSTAGIATAPEGGGGSSYGDGLSAEAGREGQGQGEGEEEDESHVYSPRPSLPSLASNRSGGSEVSSATAGTRGRRRSWASRFVVCMRRIVYRIVYRMCRKCQEQWGDVIRWLLVLRGKILSVESNSHPCGGGDVWVCGGCDQNILSQTKRGAVMIPKKVAHTKYTFFSDVVALV